MVGRIPCGVCNQYTSSPNNFLLVCACGIAFHHRCLDPPVADSSLLAMIDAFNRGVHERSIRSWRCVACMSTKLVNPMLPISAQLPARSDEVARHFPTNKIRMGQKERTDVVNGYKRGWHNRVPALQNPSRPMPQIGTSANIWPPVRQKTKIRASKITKYIGESHGRLPDSKVTVAPSEGPSVRLHSKISQPSQKKSQRDQWHPGNSFNTASTPSRDGGVEDVFKAPLSVSQTTLNATQLSLPVLQSAPEDLHDFPASPTVSRRLITCNFQGDDPVSHPIPVREAIQQPFAPSPPIWRPPLIDLHKVLKRKRSAVLQKISTTDCGGQFIVPSSLRIANFAKRDSAVEAGPHKRRRLEVSNGERDGLQTLNEQLDMVTPKQNDIILPATGRRVLTLDIALPLDGRSVDNPYESLPDDGVMVDVQKCQSMETSQQRVDLPGTETISPGVDNLNGHRSMEPHHLASPLTSHRSVDAPSRHNSLAPATTPVAPPAAALSLSKELLPIHDQLSPESHSLHPTLLTPRSLSPPRHSVTKTVLDNVVARLQSRHRDQLLPSKTLQPVRVPKLARWFKDVGPRLATTSTREKRRRWKKPSAKAAMVGISKEWTFVGAQVWTTR